MHVQKYGKAVFLFVTLVIVSEGCTKKNLTDF